MSTLEEDIKETVTMKQPWDTENVQAICTVIGTLGVCVLLALTGRACVESARITAVSEAEQVKLEPKRIQSAMEACHAACAPGQVRAWNENSTTKECVCD